MYFTVEPRQSGFTDQLVEFKALHKLGLHLGYQYLHRPFQSPRSANLDGRGRQMTFMDLDWQQPSLFKRAIRKAKRDLPFLKQAFAPPPPFDVFEFLGFHDHFQDHARYRPSDAEEEIVLEFGLETADKIGQRSIEALEQYVFAQIQNSPEKELIKFKVLDQVGIFFEEIEEAIPGYIDFRALYFEKRKKDPWPIIFPEGKVKTMMHIRQGDSAVLDTPWNSYITLWPVKKAQEFETWEDIPFRGDLIRVEDFYRFYKGFTSQFPESTFATLLFSDGFVRAERKLYNHLKWLDLSSEQARELRAAVHTYDEQKFQIFNEFDPLKQLIGENTQSLKHLIHSFLSADMVIAGKHLNMIPKMLNLYCNAQNMPLIIFLDGSNEKRENKKRFDRFLTKEMLEKTVVVNLNDSNYQTVGKMVKERLPNL